MNAIDAMKQVRELFREIYRHDDQHAFDAQKGEEILTSDISREGAQTVEPVSWNQKIRNSVDDLLSQAGYAPDSSARHQLSMMNFDPAPPPSGERAALIVLLKQGAAISRERNINLDFAKVAEQAADMLAADAQDDWHRGRAAGIEECEKLNAELKMKAQQLADDEHATLEKIADLLGTGSEARKNHATLIHCIENALRRSACLSRIEYKFFMVPVPAVEWDDEDEPGEECLLNWGQMPDEYEKQFGEALKFIAAAQQVAVPQWNKPIGEVFAHQPMGCFLVRPVGTAAPTLSLGDKLYLAAPQPPQAERVPMLPDEIEVLVKASIDPDGSFKPRRFARAIEKHHHIGVTK